MDDFWLCHFRFENIHYTGLQLLQQKDMVKILPLIKGPSSTYECYILTKNHMDSFHAVVFHRAQAPLYLVHTDLCRPCRLSHLVVVFLFSYNH